MRRRQRGLLADEMLPLDGMRERMTGADAGLQLCIHAIGDQAISVVLDLFGGREGATGARPALPHRARPARRVRRTSIASPRSSVIATVQPYHAIDDGRWAEQRHRPGAHQDHLRLPARSRQRRTACVRLGLARGAARPHPGPLRGGDARHARRRHPDGWVPLQKSPSKKRFKGYTAGSAYAEFTEADERRLSPPARLRTSSSCPTTSWRSRPRDPSDVKFADDDSGRAGRVRRAALTSRSQSARPASRRCRRRGRRATRRRR